jgi:hypothetical protein
MQRDADGLRVPHGLVDGRRKQKTDADFPDRAR